MKKRSFFALVLAVLQVICFVHITAFANEGTNELDIQNIFSNESLISIGLSYIEDKQNKDGTWGDYGKIQTAEIANILEYIVEQYNSDGLYLSDMINDAGGYLFFEDSSNIDALSRYLLVDEFREQWFVDFFVKSQNSDGGFGLSEGYASDIIDTKLALKTLADLNETEAMTKAAVYIASLQNEDGGFPYQPGLASNPELTAEIADILADCIIKKQSLSDTLSNTIHNLNEYLETNAKQISELSADNLSEVYQHLHTALFQLKTTGKYNVTPYYELQNEDGGVFDDPMATALFLELIVREQNTVIAKLDSISITNDKGYSVSSFNANENVNITIESEYETEKAYMQVYIDTPSGENIPLESESPVWNTGNYEEGTYTVKAEIKRSSNDETVAELMQTFRIEHKLAIDNISLSLSQSYSNLLDKNPVSIYADINLQNYSEEKDKVSIHWKIECSGNEVFSGDKEITEKDIMAENIILGDFVPDTSEKRTYIITAEVLFNDLTVAQSTTNYFVSDKSAAILTDVDKEYLYESTDDAEISVKIRDERVVDLILTTSSNDTALIKQYADKIEKIKKKLEKQGYIVNLCSVETSYLTAQDTFAWNEYDHPNYDVQSPYTKHIIYEEDNIKMTGYQYVPYKDFLLVPDNNNSQKLFTFDIQRDNTDWHSMYGGGFLFNTVIEDETISGYYILITSGGLRLYSLDKVNLNTFRNSSVAGTLLKTFPFSNLYEEHHIKIAADNHTLSLWDGENLVIDNYALEKIFGNGYGPITSHASHACWQRSYFTFANITMQTIKGENLYDILDNYNFVSQNSRYVINLSDNVIDNLSTEEEMEAVAQKIVDKNITFIGLGNDTNETQYQSLIDIITDNGIYYDYTEENTEDNLYDNINSREEEKRVKAENQTVATDLVFTGVLQDNTTFTQKFDRLCVGETLEFTIPQELKKLVVGTDAVLLKNITLTYKDENGISRTTSADNVTLPVITPEGKIANAVSTDKAEYSSYQDVIIFDRIHNNANNRTAKGLTNIIIVKNEDGEKVSEYTKELPELMPKGYTERQELWNTAEYAAGNYKVISQVYDGERLVSESTAGITIVPGNPKIDLEGELIISDKKFHVSDTITIDSNIENVGHADVTNGQMVIKVIDTANKKTVYKYETPLNLAVSETGSDSISVIPETDFADMKGSEYLVTYEVVTEDGEVIPLAGNGFVLEGITVTLYFIDNSNEKWIKNDNAVMELVDNTYGHDHYMMTKLDDETWAAKIPASAYNITFNRYDSSKTTQWNSWSAGGRDENNAYYVEGHEYGYWKYVEESSLEKYFHEGDIIYLDLSEFPAWESSSAMMYVNFSSASKEENGGSDIEMEAMENSEIYQPHKLDYQISEYVYAYIVTKEDEGKNTLRFWRGNQNTLWNCSVLLDYKEYKNGNNCVKVTGWNSQGTVYAK
ncbi:MAG: terpene cyclase/mutase family protein [Lachnospiraceae bacterium]|nr:terpene cyclase/mutase family protein [Lachnospiraceae bacterium]